LEKEIAEQFEEQKAKAKSKGKEPVDKPLEKVNPIWFEGSATTGEGIDKLVDALFEALPPGPMLFDEEMITDYPRKLAVSDAVREEFFKILKNELPHSIGVFVEHLREPAPDVWRVEATVYVRRQNHKGIVIGQNGKNIRRVRAGAEKTISESYGVKASIELNVKVSPDWDGNEHILKGMGCL
jgi:GTP-binding protein Era